jgi:hypothetical protein
MEYQEALSIAQAMYLDSERTDPQRAIEEVVRDLTHIAATSDGLVAVEAFEVCMALADGPQGEM